MFGDGLRTCTPVRSIVTSQEVTMRITHLPRGYYQDLQTSGQSMCSNGRVAIESSIKNRMRQKNLHKAKQKKVSASTNMAQIFMGGRSVFFFLLKSFYMYTQFKSGMPTSTFQEQGTVILVPVASAPDECRCQSRPGRAYVLDDWRRWCDELESAVSSFFGSSSAWSFSTMMWKRHDTDLLLLRQVSETKRSKNSLSPSATRNTESNVASSSTCRRRPLQKGFLSAGKLTDTATGIAIDEKQLISWARTNRPKKWRRRYMSVSKLKQQVARSEHGDARFAAADRNRVASIE